MNVKICPSCKQRKSVNDFPINTTKKDGLGTHCRECAKVFQNNWYRAHQKEHYHRILKRKIEARKRVQLVLSNSECVDCRNNNPVVLEFDHVRGRKRDNISRMVSDGLCWKTIQKEIEKCEVRCANCHKIATHKRRASEAIKVRAADS